MFGLQASEAAVEAAALFNELNVNHLVELGAGQGRDTIFFAKQGFTVDALDYSTRAIHELNKKAVEENVVKELNARFFDVRKPLPYQDESVDAVFSHMLYCMELSTEELVFLNQEIFRVLKPGGLNIFTVRNVNDPLYQCGVYHGEELYEIDGFVVHFFTQDKINMLSERFIIRERKEMFEGELPRTLYYTVFQK